MSDIQNCQIIGIDCAADPKNIGVAYTTMAGTELTLKDVQFGASGDRSRRDRLLRLAKDIVERITADRGTPTLLALDAPLGWPTPMGHLLSHHTAGAPLPGDADPDSLFRRGTDQFIAENLGKTPIEVGANLIARVTHTTLRLIGMIRSQVDGMATNPLRSHEFPQESINFIEVYPALAGPFLLRRLPVRNTWDYWNHRETGLAKALSEERDENKTHINQLCGDLRDNLSSPSMRVVVGLDPKGMDRLNTQHGRDHGLDAILCAWTGFRFLHGRCEPPQGKIRRTQLEQEGWIWFDRRVLRTARGEASEKSPSGV